MLILQHIETMYVGSFSVGPIEFHLPQTFEKINLGSIMHVCVLFNLVIQWYNASPGKPTRHLVFNMLIKTYEAQ